MRRPNRCPPRISRIWLRSGPGVPDAARRLANAISLHDGLLRGVERTNGRLELLFRAGDQQVGYFDAWHRYDGVGSITVPRCGLTIRIHPRTLMIVLAAVGCNAG